MIGRDIKVIYFNDLKRHLQKLTKIGGILKNIKNVFSTVIK